MSTINEGKPHVHGLASDDGSATTNGNGAATSHDHVSNGAGSGYQSGNAMSRFITPGGNPIDNSQPAFPVYHRRFANPAPLGLMSFAATTFLLSLYNVHARGVVTPNVILGMAMGYGGLVQLIAGVEEWACGNTFGATAFSSYGGFWISFGTLYIPQFGVTTAYTEAAELTNALGLYLATWGIVTFIFFIASLRSSVALVSLFFFLTITFFLLAAGFLRGENVTLIKAGGGFGIVTAAVAAYTALAGMLTRDTSHFLIPVGDLSRAKQ